MFIIIRDIQVFVLLPKASPFVREDISDIIGEAFVVVGSWVGRELLEKDYGWAIRELSKLTKVKVMTMKSN